jgi:hypothetical protein
MEQGGFSQDASYDVCVKLGVDHMGRPQFSDAIVHFSERRNAVAYKSELEARGETVHVHKCSVYNLSEAAKKEWFMDYEPKAHPADAPETYEGAGPAPVPPVAASEPTDRNREPPYRRWFAG